MASFAPSKSATIVAIKRSALASAGLGGSIGALLARKLDLLSGRTKSYHTFSFLKTVGFFAYFQASNEGKTRQG